MAVLKSIRSTGGTRLSLSYIDRKDVGDKLLSRIEVIPKGVTTAIRTFQFDYIYSMATSYYSGFLYDSSYYFRPYCLLIGAEKSRFKQTEINDIIKQANQFFKELGINVEVKQYAGKELDIKKLDKTDAVAVLGSRDEFISTVQKMDPALAQDMRTSRKIWAGRKSPEELRHDGWHEE